MEQKKTSKQEMKSKATKQKILDISLRIMREKGYDQMQVSHICKEAGVSVGAFYHHFPSKEDIIIEAYKEVDEYFTDYVIPVLKDVEPSERIIQYIGYQAKYAADKGYELMSQVYKTQIFNGNSFFVSSSRVLPQGLKQIILEGQERQQFRQDLSAEFVTRQLLRFSRGIIYDWCVHQGTYELVEEMESAIRLFSGCLLNDPVLEMV